MKASPSAYVPDDIVGGEFAAIMPGHAVAQMHDPALMVVRVTFVGGGEARMPDGLSDSDKSHSSKASYRMGAAQPRLDKAPALPI